MIKKKNDLEQITIDKRSSSVDLGFERNWKVVVNTVNSMEDTLSREDKLGHKIFVDDVWIWYKDLRNPRTTCPGEKRAIEYARTHDRLDPECEKCRKVLIYGFDEEFLRRITEYFLTRHLDFDFKIAGDLGVFVAYRRGDKAKDDLIAYLENLLKSYQLRGRVQWRIAGKYLQVAVPGLFKSAKVLNYKV